jgi:hypothetical protein
MKFGSFYFFASAIYYFDSAQDFILFLCLEIDGTKVVQNRGGFLSFFQLFQYYYSLTMSKTYPGNAVESRSK